MAKHALLSPSAASRWSLCPASMQYPADTTTSAAAEEGTRAHEAAERILANQGPDKQEYDIQLYLDCVRSMHGQLFIETRLPVEAITGEKGAKGTADAIVIAKSHLHIVDLKYGKGIKVDAEYNKQLAIYAMAAVQEFDWAGPFNSVSLVIVQPRLDHISAWHLRLEELKLFVEQQITMPGKRALAIATGRAKPTEHDYSPGEDTCRWCTGKTQCPALNGFVAAADEGSLEAKYSRIPVVEMWCKAVSAEVYNTLSAGGSVPGYKLVAGRKTRELKDGAEEALQSYEGIYTEPTLKSVAQLEKVVPKKVLEPYVEVKLGRPTIAPDSDKREPLSIFENLNA